jgi:drug/metabolite transporter (DMT)-like permease
MICGCFFIAWMGQFAHLLRGSGDGADSAGLDWRIGAVVRGGLAFLFAIGLARLSGAKLVLRGTLALWVRGCASSISLLCTFYSLSQLPPSEVLTLTNTFPIWVALLSWPLLRTRPTLSVWLSAGCGVLGVVLIQWPHYHSDGGNQEASWAIPLSLMAALTNAIAMLGLNRVKDIHPWAIVVHYSGIATLFVVGACLVGPLPDPTPLADGTTLLLLLGVGVAATLGQVCLTRAFTTGDPARISVVTLTQVVFALGLHLIFEGFNVPAITLTGIALVLAPTAWVMAGRHAAPKAVPQPTSQRRLSTNENPIAPADKVDRQLLACK